MEKKMKVMQNGILVLFIALVAFVFRINALENEVSPLDYLLDNQYDRIMIEVIDGSERIYDPDGTQIFP